ncbi:glutathione-dependent formaldehyde-activating enzyme domain-containing protein [Purpureocillium lavendulum]|uniref:Glutathione-dependent formaldehyde-activating enzyme domain-containing protein n=1 Tax=Purpureocillium lavendulum TaxID=1247861 RepID=A0AB34FJJ4_9HYPO|nr:glutathione-dependent formaldehyde-activating enzyme domain-containing protein [Purpureocillium lavendulum]
MASTEKPKTISGGCLCESVRYTITVPPDHDFDDAIGTCQCSWCRKVTGSLMFRFHQFKKVDVVFDADSTLRTYEAAPGNHRGFCCKCGSYMFFRRETSKLINLAVGCFDDEDLKLFGPLLTKAGGNLWCRNEIPGVTDHLVGEKHDTEPHD